MIIEITKSQGLSKGPQIPQMGAGAGMLGATDSSDRGGYQIEGERTEVEKLLQQLRDHA